MTTSRIRFACLVALVTGGACTDYESATNLNPDGPPMIEQVRLTELYTAADGQLKERGPLFAFGTHPMVTSADQAHPVTSALPIANKLRVIMDELLIGNYLEEINCRGQIDEDSYDTVPLGATPDDVAKCAVSKDVLKKSCTGDHVMCICKLDGGCGDVAKGEPVGVEDVNQDGSADHRRMIANAVGIKCGGIEVPINPYLSYWNPSGDQQVPAKGGFEALGPAIVLVPDLLPGATMGSESFPSNTTCNLTFAPNIVDKQNNQVCAPPDGDIKQDCTPGDVSAFSFKVQPLTLRSSAIADGDVGVMRSGVLNFSFTSPIKPSTVAAGVTISDGANPFTTFTAATSIQTITVTIPAATQLAANTTYTIKFGTQLTDLYDQAMPQAKSISFTTGM